MTEKTKLPDAEESKLEVVTEATAPEVPQGISTKPKFDPSTWQPHTSLGRDVKSGKIKSIDEILNLGKRILEPEIVDMLVPNLESEIILLGQSKGKFGGGKKNVWRQTQKKTKEGNRPHFATILVIGNKNGYLGMGFGKAKETVPAKEKAIRNAKINFIKIRRGCGSWACNCAEPHTLPFAIKGKSGSVELHLLPAPKGTALCVEKECAKMLKLAGLKDVYSKVFGQTRNKINVVKACFNALKSLSKIKIQPEYYKIAGVVE